MCILRHQQAYKLDNISISKIEHHSLPDKHSTRSVWIIFVWVAGEKKLEKKKKCISFYMKIQRENSSSMKLPTSRIRHCKILRYFLLFSLFFFRVCVFEKHKQKAIWFHHIYYNLQNSKDHTKTISAQIGEKCVFDSGVNYPFNRHIPLLLTLLFLNAYIILKRIKKIPSAKSAMSKKIKCCALCTAGYCFVASFTPCCVPPSHIPSVQC